MENEFNNRIDKAMKRFEQKEVKITISGTIESKFYIKDLKYKIEEDLLIIEDTKADTYLEIDIDDVEDTYAESSENEYALLVLRIGRNLQVEIQTKGDNVITVREKVLKFLEDAKISC